MSGRVTLGAAVAAARARLGEAGIEAAALEARVLAAHAFAMTPEALIRHAGDPAPAGGGRLYTELVERRAAGEPVAYLTGCREFWSLGLAVSPDCLVPRPDSEALVAALLEAVGMRSGALRVLDLGTGSGCLLLALLSEWPGARGVGVDAGWSTVAAARANARHLGLAGRAQFVCSDWAAALTGPFDVVVSNPPYIPTADINALPRDVREFEPRAALDGGPDGLDAVRRVLAATASLLAPGGVAACEFGPGQAGDAEALAGKAGLVREQWIADLAGRTRGILLRSAAG